MKTIPIPMTPGMRQALARYHLTRLALARANKTRLAWARANKTRLAWANAEKDPLLALGRANEKVRSALSTGTVDGGSGSLRQEEIPDATMLAQSGRMDRARMLGKTPGREDIEVGQPEQAEGHNLFQTSNALTSRRETIEDARARLTGPGPDPRGAPDTTTPKGKSRGQQGAAEGEAVRQGKKP